MNKKLFEIDVDDPSELKKYISKLQSLRRKSLEKLGYRQLIFNGSNRNAKEVLRILDSCIELINFQPGQYYVYAHTDPRNKLKARSSVKDAWLALNCPGIEFKPFYIGKGKADRYKDLNRNDSHRKIRSAIKNTGEDIVPIILKNNLSEQSALALEEILIDILGLISLSPQGYLTNLDEGRNQNYRRSMYSEEMNKLLKLNGF